MLKYIAVIAVLFFTSTKVYASFIYANDFAVGEDSTYLTPNATLSWLEGTGKKTSSSIFSSGGFNNQHFGGVNSAATYDTFPSIWNEINGSSESQSYAALQIDFKTSVRSFGLKAENHTSSPFLVYLFGTDGNFLGVLTANVVNTGAVGSPGAEWIFDATYNWNFDFDVGQIKIGGASDAGYIYGLDVTYVPEPSSVILLLIGLACVVKRRGSISGFKTV